jgi:hypothetical protein
MAFERAYDDQTPVLAPACVHLRNKTICLTGDLKSADDPAESGSHHCWCNLTQHVLGPDQKDVGRQNCVPGRNCYRETC